MPSFLSFQVLRSLCCFLFFALSGNSYLFALSNYRWICILRFFLVSIIIKCLFFLFFHLLFSTVIFKSFIFCGTNNSLLFIASGFPLLGYPTICLSILKSINIWHVSGFGLFQRDFNKAEGGKRPSLMS